MKLLELFAGTRSVGKAFEKRGHKVFSVEWNKDFENIDLYDDILNVSSKQIIDLFGRPDVIWASPNCSTFSIAAISRHRTKNPVTGSLDAVSDYAKFCDRVNRHVLQLISELDPKYLKNLYCRTDLALCGHVHSFYITRNAAGQGAHECVVGNGTIGENTTFALYCIDSFGRYMEIYKLKLNNRKWDIELLSERLELRPKEYVRFNDSQLNQRFCVNYKTYLGENKQNSISAGYFFLKLYSIVLGAEYNYSYSKDTLNFGVESAAIEQAIKQVLYDCYGTVIGSVSKRDHPQLINYFKKLNWLCIDDSGNMYITIEGISLYNNLTKGAE